MFHLHKMKAASTGGQISKLLVKTNTYSLNATGLNPMATKVVKKVPCHL